MERERKINTISKRQCSISTIINNGVLKHKYSKNINNQLKELYPLYEKYNLDETYEKLLNIYDICPICGDKIYVFKDGINCKNTAVNNNHIYKKENECNEFELWHLKYILLVQKLHNFVNNNHLNLEVKEFTNLYYPFDFNKYTFKELYKKFMNFYIICDICNSKIYYFQNSRCPNIGIIPNGNDTGFHEKEDKNCNEFELIHKKFRNEKRGINGKNTIHIAIEKHLWLYNNDQEYHDKMFKVYSELGSRNVHYMIESIINLWENDPEWAENQRKICAENGKENGPKNVHFAKEKLDWLRENDPEWVETMSLISSENIKGAIKYWQDNPEEAEKQRKYALEKAREAYNFLYENDAEFREKENQRCSEMGKKYGPENIKKCNEYLENHPEEAFKIRSNNGKKNIEKLKELWNDEEWAENQRKICVKNGKEYGSKNIEKCNEYLNEHQEIRQEIIKKAIETQIQNLKELFSKNPIKFNDKFISYDDLQQLKENDICGSWVIRAKFKAYKGTNRENERFRLGPFKTIKVYDEMSWAGRVIKHPEKQNWIINDSNPWKYAKWWYISNLYYDFEFELITDENGVTEEEALIAESAYASKYDLFVEFTEDEEGRRIPVVEKHSYWSL